MKGIKLMKDDTNDKAHGRIETRRCWVGYDALDNIDGSENWEGFKTVVMIEFSQNH